tara:strand:- start:17277 stop:18068 length:792 start_codon:yes stop_codon:yes gene_type:complete
MTQDKTQKIVLVSGGFDPVHIGHIRMFNEAKSLGTKLIVILNNDDFLFKKKGYFFMNQDERREVLKNISSIDEVYLSVDKDLTVIESIKELSKKYKIDFFCNGGDRKNIEDIPEYDICKRLGIDLIFDSGGGKIQSSSELTSNFLDNQNNFETVKKPWGKYTTFDHQSDFLLKKINVDPGERLSLQSHDHRAEVWVVVKGIANVLLNERSYQLKTGETIFIPTGDKHMLSNDFSEELVLIEVQLGEDLREDDIFRYEDKYGRG